MNNKKMTKNIAAVTFTMLLIIGIAVCIIIDIALSGTFTWSLIPISSIIFAWLIIFPIFIFHKKQILASLVSCTIFIIPYLFVLNQVMETSKVFLPVSISMAVIGALYLWIIYFIFHTLNVSKWIAGAAALLLTIPIDFLIIFILARVTPESRIDVWDIMSFTIVVLISAILIIIDIFRRKNITNKELQKN